jgi:hypothetical protein
MQTVFYVLTLSACASLPPLQPQLAERVSGRPFPKGHWQLVHRIEARFPGNHKALMMGALELDSATGRLNCALMTVEGFTLFSAGFNPGDPVPLTITRAVPPFDQPGFAEGLMADLHLLFFVPEARETTGSLDDGPVRRYHYRDGRTIDVIARPNGRFRIDFYDTDARLVRRARLIFSPSTAAPQNIATKIFLEAKDDAGYTLKLDLIDAVPLGAANDIVPDSPSAKDFQ